MEVQVRLNADRFLLYLVQQVSKEPSEKILGFFSDLGRSVAQIGADAMPELRTKSMKKKINFFYPGTDIPFHMLVEGHLQRGKFDPIQRQHVETEPYCYASISVCFPESPDYVNQDELDNAVMEAALLGGSSMPLFQKPDPKIPKMFKQLFKEVLERHNEQHISNVDNLSKEQSVEKCNASELGSSL